MIAEVGEPDYLIDPRSGTRKIIDRPPGQGGHVHGIATAHFQFPPEIKPDE